MLMVVQLESLEENKDKNLLMDYADALILPDIHLLFIYTSQPSK